jgi:hypothetical protein
MTKRNKNNKLMKEGVIHAFGIFVYVAGVSLLMSGGAEVFVGHGSFWGPVAGLLLFVISAAVTGLLVFGKPAMMYVNGRKEDAFTLLFNTIIVLIIIFVLVLVSLAV